MLAAAEMSTGGILVLGAIAGFTIFLGLPMGRLRSPAPRLRAALNAVAIGILVFLLFDVLSHANEPVEVALDKAVNDGGSWWRFLGLAAVFAIGLAVGLIGLVYYERWTENSRRASRPIGPGAARVDELSRRPMARWTDAQHLAFLIALGIGLHNFSEGLAIGQSAASGEISLALLLIIGFGLHNATEGFGIVAPMAAEQEQPRWSFLALLGLIGGGPTFIGTVVGQSFTSDPVSVLFLSLAAGSILYVIIQLVGVALRSGHKEMLYWGVFLGLIAGFATDFIVSASGV